MTVFSGHQALPFLINLIWFDLISKSRSEASTGGILEEHTVRYKTCLAKESEGPWHGLNLQGVQIPRNSLMDRRIYSNGAARRREPRRKRLTERSECCLIANGEGGTAWARKNLAHAETISVRELIWDPDHSEIWLGVAGSFFVSILHLCGGIKLLLIGIW